jgi:hypothetical protein
MVGQMREPARGSEARRTMQGDNLVHPAHVERDASIRLFTASKVGVSSISP